MQPLKQASVSEQIYAQLRTAILSGELPPGQRIIEMDVATRMGTSQGPVREALSRLESDGLVEKQPRSSTFVTALNLDEIRELFQIRALVEKFAIQRAATVITPEQCDELQGLVGAMHVAAQAGDMLSLASHDMAFHQHLCEWSGSSSLLRAWTPLYSQIQRFVIQNHPHHFANLDEIATLHEPIVEALQQGDPFRAGREIEAHVLLITRQLEKVNEEEIKP